jgi:hypothetical protein
MENREDQKISPWTEEQWEKWIYAFAAEFASGEQSETGDPTNVLTPSNSK